MCHYFEYDTNLSFTQVVEYCEISKGIKEMNGKYMTHIYDTRNTYNYSITYFKIQSIICICLECYNFA